jgi:hypothetical protein
MRTTLLLFWLIAAAMTASAQKISYDPPPNLPQPIGKADYKFIVDSSVAIIAMKYKVDHVEAGSIHVVDQQHQGGVINLDNLILKCLAEGDRSAWMAIIRDHFSNLFNSIDQQRQLDLTNYETMKKYMSIRIYPRETVDERGGTDSLVARTDLEGTYTLLMLDFPGAFTPVRKNMFDRWKKDAADVFRCAQANVDSQKVEKVNKTFDLQGTQVEISMLGEENYAASYALDLMNNSPELVGGWGSAVAMPNKALVSICKISRERPLDFVKFIQLTQPFIEKSYHEHQQPVSDQFFWYYQGKFTRINVSTDSTGHVNVISPFGLTELMTKKP